MSNIESDLINNEGDIKNEIPFYTVSGGDSPDETIPPTSESYALGEHMGFETLLSQFEDEEAQEEMIALLEQNNEYLEQIVEYQEAESLSLWEKELDSYNALESLNLILLVTIVGILVFKIIGDIISCKV